MGSHHLLSDAPKCSHIACQLRLWVRHRELKGWEVGCCCFVCTEMGALRMFFEGSFVRLPSLSIPGGGPLPFIEEAPHNPKAVSPSARKAASAVSPFQMISTHLL